MQERIWLGLGVVGDKNAGEEESGHRREHRPSVCGRLGHSSQCDREPGRDEKNREHLHEVRKWRWILERMGAVGVEEASAVCSQHLDGFLGCDGALGNALCGDRLSGRLAVRAGGRYGHWLYELHLVIAAKILNDSLGDQ